MCLYIRDEHPRVAKRDIVVLKYLKQITYLKQNGARYESPCRGTPVTLGKLMVAQPKTPHIACMYSDFYGRDIYSMGGGVIHAKLHESDDYGNYCAKAIIPKGTEYWIDPFGLEIAATQMLITKCMGTSKSVDVQFFKEILESAPEKNGIRIGDYQMIDDSFVHPTKRIAKTKVRGIVCGFYKDGSPIICALEMFRETWDAWNIRDNSRIEEPVVCEKATESFNGREITAQYKKRIKKEDKWRFRAFERCVNYRKDKNEDWYFGSFGEVVTMLDNAIYLHAAHAITGLGFIIISDYWFWSSSECLRGSWCSHLYGGRVTREWIYKKHTLRVVPFYAFNKQKEEVE